MFLAMKAVRFVSKWLAIAWVFGLCVAISALLSTVALAQSAVASETGELALIPRNLREAQQKASAASLSGTVVDANGPVAGATVRVQASANSVLSAQDGAFTLSDLKATGVVTVTAWAPGYYNGLAV